MNDNLQFIKDYLAQNLDNPPEDLTPASKLTEIGLESLEQAELVFELEEKYNLRLPSDIQPPETIGDLIALMEKYKPENLDG